MTPPKSEAVGTSTQQLCSTCASHDWEYHIRRYEDGRSLEDRKSWDEDAASTLFLPKTDKLGGSYFLAADSTRFLLNTYQETRLNSVKCELCALVVAQVESDDRCAPIAESSAKLLCLVRTSAYDYSVVVIGVPESELMFRGTALVAFTVVGKYSQLPKRSIVDNANIQPGLIRQWLDTCTEFHNDCVQHSLNRRKSPFDLDTFKVIDVETRLVVPAPPDTSYVALSYVWGRAKMYKALKKDFVPHKKRFRHGDSPMVLHLDAIPLPQTIEDAMHVVKQIGARYLWVDALCITQDDDEELLKSLKQMHLVYGNALVTICAMQGEDADAGLTRLHPCTDSEFEKTADIRGLCVVASDFYEFDKMKWATRAWTYQESVYSVRCILFSAVRVFFSCSHGLHSEERPDGITITSGFDPTLPHHRVLPKYPTIDTGTSPSTSFDEYAYHVESFSERQLSFQTDILKAFTAVMSDLTSSLGFQFCWGLPTQMFELSLCWVPQIEATWSGDLEVNCHIAPSTFQLPVHQPREGRDDFPSWSWSGHKFETAILYSSEIRSILNSQGSVVSHVLWPWDPEYPKSDAFPDAFADGVLDIEVDLTTMTKPKQGRSFLVDNEDSDDLHFDDSSVWKPMEARTCFRICEAVTTYNVWDGFGSAGSVSSGESEEESRSSEMTLSVLLAVSQGENGLYMRDGLFVILSSEWDEQEAQRQRIRLG